MITGQTQWKKFQKGEKLSFLQAIKAQCFICNGEENEDCKGGKTCPLYQHSPYRSKKGVIVGGA